MATAAEKELQLPGVVATDPDETEGDRDTADDTGARPAPRKRRRLVISCTECHRRKQKCDRKLPCTNCVSRNKQSACKYDTCAPTMRGHTCAPAARGRDGKGSNDGGTSSPDGPPPDSIPTKVANFGYSQTGASTLSFLRKIEGAHPSEPLSHIAQGMGQHGDHLNMRERYKSLIRQLPARTYIDQLVEVYFVGINWQYDSLEEDVFRRQLAEWHSLPFSVLTNGGPQALPPDLRAFPALLFQVLATSLLLLPSELVPTFEPLKYAGNMTFEDLAVDYSESGVAILSLLGKRQMTLTTVLTGFLRAAFLKYVALVTEAWHAIGTAIRDGQEIGLHRDSLDPKPASNDAEAVLENQWEVQRRRKLWMTLVGWDVHIGVVLGRPTSVNLGLTPPTLPVDAPFPKDRSKTPVLPRGEDDPPTSLTRSIWAYKLMSMLRLVIDLEKDGPCPKDFSKVDAAHQLMLDMQDQTPSCFRVENPDKRFDDLPECYWVPGIRATLPQLTSFNLMALHRPYIFTRPKSRTAALRACLDMLTAQKRHFQNLKPEQYRMFSLFFGTFDAIVLMASIYILFPKEHPELVHNATQQFRWSMERFEAMSDRNALAKAAMGVLQAIYLRLKKSVCLGQQQQPPQASPQAAHSRSPLPSISAGFSTSTSSSTAAARGQHLHPDLFESPLADTSPRISDTRTASSSISGPSSGSTNTFTPTAGSDVHSTSSTSASVPVSTGPAADGGQEQQPPVFDLSLPTDFDWSTIQPIFATGDLIYNDLVGVRDGSVYDSSAAAAPYSSSSSSSTPRWPASSTGADGGAAPQPPPWQFDGDFGNDSVWSLLNQFGPY